MIYRSFLHPAIAGNSTNQFRSGLISLLHHLQRLIKLAHHMIELEVYAAGVRDPNKILELDHQLEAAPACVTRSIAITTSCLSSSMNPRSIFEKFAAISSNSVRNLDLLARFHQSYAHGRSPGF